MCGLLLKRIEWENNEQNEIDFIQIFWYISKCISIWFENTSSSIFLMFCMIRFTSVIHWTANSISSVSFVLLLAPTARKYSLCLLHGPALFEWWPFSKRHFCLLQSIVETCSAWIVALVAKLFRLPLIMKNEKKKQRG